MEDRGRGEWILQIANIRYPDSGDYECQVKIITNSYSNWAKGTCPIRMFINRLTLMQDYMFNIKIHIGRNIVNKQSESQSRS